MTARWDPDAGSGIDTRLVARLANRGHRPGVIGRSVAQRALTRMRLPDQSLPLLARHRRRWGEARDLPGPPIVYPLRPEAALGEEAVATGRRLDTSPSPHVATARSRSVPSTPSPPVAASPAPAGASPAGVPNEVAAPGDAAADTAVEVQRKFATPPAAASPAVASEVVRPAASSSAPPPLRHAPHEDGAPPATGTAGSPPARSQLAGSQAASPLRTVSRRPSPPAGSLRTAAAGTAAPPAPAATAPELAQRSIAEPPAPRPHSVPPGSTATDPRQAPPPAPAERVRPVVTARTLPDPGHPAPPQRVMPPASPSAAEDGQRRPVVRVSRSLDIAARTGVTASQPGRVPDPPALRRDPGRPANGKAAPPVVPERRSAATANPASAAVPRTSTVSATSSDQAAGAPMRDGDPSPPVLVPRVIAPSKAPSAAGSATVVARTMAAPQHDRARPEMVQRAGTDDDSDEESPDLEDLAHEVMRRVIRSISIERERRGWSQWP